MRTTRWSRRCANSTKTAAAPRVTRVTRRSPSRCDAASQSLGIASVLPPDESSVVLRSYDLPRGIGYDALHDALKARGFVIYAGQGNLSSRLFRISTMGAITAEDVDRLVDAVRETIAS